MYGVWRIGAHGRRLLERLAERVPVTVFLPTVGGDADEAHVELRSWLARTGAGASVPAVSTAGPTALTHLQATLFGPARLVDPDGTVQLVSAPDPLSEVTRGRAHLPRLGTRRDLVPRDGGRVPRRCHLPAGDRGGVHRGRNPAFTSTTARRSPSDLSGVAFSR